MSWTDCSRSSSLHGLRVRVMKSRAIALERLRLDKGGDTMSDRENDPEKGFPSRPDIARTGGDHFLRRLGQ